MENDLESKVRSLRYDGINREVYCVSGAEAGTDGNLSRMSTAPVATENMSGIRLPTDDHVIVTADASHTSVDVLVAVADISLPPMPDVAIPAPVDDLSFHAGSSIAEPMSVAPAEDFGDDTAFNETLQSAAADITLFAVSLNFIKLLAFRF